MECEKDCWKCDLEGCPYTLKVSEDIDTEIRFKTLKREASGASRYKRYRATPKGRKTLINAKKRYESKNPDKVALWQFKSRYKRKYGTEPSDQICQEWEAKRKHA